MLPALVVDGHSPSERGEAELVTLLLRASGLFPYVCLKHASLPAPLLSKPWSVVWIACHTTIYRSANRGSLETRTGSVYRRFAVADQIKMLRSDLLVLSSCHTYGGPFIGPYQSSTVISHKGPVTVTDALVFSARFVRTLLRTTRKNRFTPSAIRSAFSIGKRSADDQNWRMSVYAST